MRSLCRRGTRLFGEGDPVGNFDGKMYVIITGVSQVPSCLGKMIRWTGSVSLSGESRITGELTMSWMDISLASGYRLVR